MRSESGPNDSAKAKAFLIDPETMMVVWMNESASHDAAGALADIEGGIPVDRAVPMAQDLGMSEAVRAVAETGVSQHLRADLVSMARGSVVLALSVYRLPDMMVLVLAEHAWANAQLHGAFRVRHARVT